MAESKGVWVFSESFHLMLEMLGKARELADALKTEAVSILIGNNIEAKWPELIEYGADRVYVADSHALASFNADACLDILHNLLVHYGAEILLVGSTRNGKPLAARLATRLETGCVPDCSDLSLDEKRRLVCERMTYGGKAVARIVFKSKPQIATVPARVLEKNSRQKRSGEVIRLNMPIKDTKIEIVERKPLKASKIRIEDAEIIVSGGRGLENKNDVVLLEDLAHFLGGHVGCSRPLVEDRKWFSEWIGLSGHKVKPKLYIACGISGVIQHIAGIRDSKVIVAINKDPEAPIFEIADYGIVGNFYEILPVLKEALKKQLH